MCPVTKVASTASHHEKFDSQRNGMILLEHAHYFYLQYEEREAIVHMSFPVT